jgi:hypothetical protein
VHSLVRVHCCLTHDLKFRELQSKDEVETTLKISISISVTLEAQIRA